MTLRIGILGAARIAPAAVVHPAAAIEGVEVVCVGARSLQAAQDFAAAHGIASAHEGYAEVVASREVDLVYVALPTALHAEWTIRAAAAGKHVLCEKPFALDSAQARTMLAAGEAAGVRIIEAFHHRYHPAFATFLDLVQGGAIGTITAIDAEFSAPIPAGPGEFRHSLALGGGAMRDLGCYPLSWSLSLVDAPIGRLEVDAVLTPGGVDETVHAALHFASGVTARLRTSMAAEQAVVYRLRVEGSRGAITFENPLAPHLGSRIMRDGAADLVFGPESGTTYFHQLAAVTQAIASGSPLPTEGAAILRQQAALDVICERIYGAQGARA
jgi:predicted dehydrogenase